MTEKIKAKLVKIEEKDSKYGHFFFYLFFKGDNGKSYRTCIYPKYRNFKRWEQIIKDFFKEEEIWLKNLRLKSARLIDADSDLIRI